MPSEKAPILLVEDDEVDVMMMQRAFKKLGIENPLHVAKSGDHGLAMLRGEGHPKIDPALILFDMKMPKMDGITFLREIRADPELQSLVAVALTSSNQPRDVEAAYRYNAAGYFVKPVAFEELLELVEIIHRYWHHCEPPRNRS